MNEQENIRSEGLIPAEEMYNQYARYYDMMTARHTEDLPMYEQITATMPAPYLEVGCGTGRVLSRLIDQKPETMQGHYLTGVDVSSEMLAICESKLRESIADGSLQVVKHDFSFSPLKGQKFNAAFVTFFTLNYIPEHLQKDFLNNIGSSLSPDGIITLDCFFPYVKWHPENSGKWRDKRPVGLDDDQIEFEEKADMLTDTIEQREWIFTEQDGSITKITTDRMYISPENGKGLLESAGFTDIHRAFEYDLPGTQDFSEGTQGYNFVLIARKP